MQRKILYLAWTVALLGTLGSLFFSNALGWLPCVLCWYQRILLYPLLIILTVGVLRDSDDLEFFVLPFSFLGIGVSIFHNLLQYGIIPEKLSPCTNGVSCTIPYHFFFNWLTVPLLSLCAFIVITICMYIYRNHRKAKV